MSFNIQSEINYYQDILSYQSKISKNDLLIYKRETVEERRKRVSNDVYVACNGEVKYGPFAGLKLFRNYNWSTCDDGSKCLGLYEVEILNFIKSFDNKKFSTFINIGAADGYYPIGMLYSKRVSKSICFEIQEQARSCIKSTWLNNGRVGDLIVCGEANTSSLSNISEDDIYNSLILIDIEGAELDLLTPEFLYKFRNAHIIVEIHYWVDDFINKYYNILNNASKLFYLNIIERVDRNTVSLPELRVLPDDSRLLLVSEGRPGLANYILFSPMI